MKAKKSAPRRLPPPGNAAITFTIGYAGRTLQSFFKALQDAGVERVVDVRALPVSRIKGFSKTPLGEALSLGKIEYVHLPRAGNPYRDRKQDIETCLALYAAYLDGNPAVLEEVEATVSGHRAALLCLEATACACHRSVIANRLSARDPHRQILHL